MSDTTNNAETTTVVTREDGTMYTEHQFSLKSTKEVADRFRGDHNVPFRLPAAVKGDLDATLRNIRAFVHPEADFAEWLAAKVNGQGLRLDIQKEIKDFLAPRDAEDKDTVEVDGEAVRVTDAPVEVVLAEAGRIGENYQSGAPRTRSGGGSKGKLAAAEAKVAKVANTAVEMYKGLSRAMRRQYRDALLETGQITQEQLDEIDNA